MAPTILNKMSSKEIFSVSYLLIQVHGTQLGWLGLGIHHDIEHGADGLWHAEVCGPAALLKLGLERRPCPLDKEKNVQGWGQDFRNIEVRSTSPSTHTPPPWIIKKNVNLYLL